MGWVPSALQIKVAGLLGITHRSSGCLRMKGSVGGERGRTGRWIGECGLVGEWEEGR